jgi:hypothetical protein
VRAGRASAGWTTVTLEGWVASYRLANRADTLDRTVVGNGMAPLRVADGTSQVMVAEVEPGTILKRIAERNGWTLVRRSAWVRTASLQAGAATPTASRPAAGAPPPATSRDSGDDSNGSRAADSSAQAQQRTLRATSLRTAPGGEERAALRAGATVQTLARDGGWALVRLEGWVPERDLTIADSAADAGLTPAELRANPSAHRGKVVRWDVQVIALQRADVLRRGMTPDEPYLIARAPGVDASMVYLTIPAHLLSQARALPALSRASITARVREGRSEPVGVPILELVTLARIQ